MERLREVISNSGLTLPKFAEKVGVSKNTLIRYRDGTTSPPIDFIQRVADEFLVDPSWLAFGKSAHHPEDKESPKYAWDYRVEDFSFDEFQLVFETLKRLIEYLREEASKLEDKEKLWEMAILIVFIKIIISGGNTAALETITYVYETLPRRLRERSGEEA